MKKLMKQLGWTASDSILLIICTGAVFVSVWAYGYVHQVAIDSYPQPPAVGSHHAPETAGGKFDVLHTAPPSDVLPKDNVHSGEGSYSEGRWIEVVALCTAYVPRSESYGKFNDGITATGTQADVLDGVAVDPDLIPYGSLVYIPGVGMKVADDTGSSVKKNGDKGTYHIDIRMATEEECFEWGRKNMKVLVIEPQDLIEGIFSENEEER